MLLAPLPCLAPHPLLKSTPALWAQLKPVGVWAVESDDDEPGYELHLANCTCGSTLAVEVRK